MNSCRRCVAAATLICMALTLLMTSLKVKVVEGQQQLVYRLKEDQPPGTVVIRDVLDDSGLGAQHSDPAVRSSLKLSILRGGEGERLFRLVRDVEGPAARGRWTLVTAHVLDRDLLCPGAVQCPLRVDVGVSPAQYFQILRVEVELLDVNDHSPEFLQSSVLFRLPESHGEGAVPASAQLTLPAAVDRDSPVNGVAGYRLSTDSETGFQLDSRVADQLKLVLTKTLDREVSDRHQLRVIAYDGGSRQLSGTLTVNIQVVDVNDHRPAFSQATYRVRVREDTPTGTLLLRVVATDADQGDNGRVRYQLKPEPDNSLNPDDSSLLEIDSETGDVKISGSLDYEAKKTHTTTVVASDCSPLQPTSSETTLVVDVIDVNDNPPTFSLRSSDTAKVSDDTLKIGRAAKARTRLANLIATDADSDGTQHISCRLAEQSNGTLALALVPSAVDDGFYYVVNVDDVEYGGLTQAGGWAVLECSDDGDPVMMSRRNISIVIVVQPSSPTVSTESFPTAVTGCGGQLYAEQHPGCTTSNLDGINSSSLFTQQLLDDDGIALSGHVIVMVGAAAAGFIALAAAIAAVVVCGSFLASKAKQRRRRATAAAIKNVLGVVSANDEDDNNDRRSMSDNRTMETAVYRNDAGDRFDNVILTLDSEPLNYSARHQRWLSSVGVCPASCQSDRSNDVDSGFADMTSSITSYHQPLATNSNGNAAYQLYYPASTVGRSWLPESVSFQESMDDVAMCQDRFPVPTLQSFSTSASAFCHHDGPAWPPGNDYSHYYPGSVPARPGDLPDSASDLMSSSIEGRLPPVIRVGTMAHSTSTGSRKSVRFAEDNEVA